MPQYFIHDTLVPGSTALITGDDFHHLSKVRRVKPGDPIQLRDAGGTLFDGWIASVREDSLLVDVSSVSRSGSSLPHVTLAMALLKNKNFDLVVEKSVEVGVSRIVPLLSERTVPEIGGKEEKKTERWRAIAGAASKQSLRSFVPEVEPPVSFRDFVSRSHEGLLVCAHPSSEGMTLRDAAASFTGDRAVILVGPEGGFSPSEIALAVSNAFVNVNIGETQMRAETAGIVLPSLVIYELMSR
jgi:16S rRNA (uracil1498-N3)-methyltransferase